MPAQPTNETTTFTHGPWRVDETKALGAYGVWTDYATHPGHDGKGYPSEICSVYRSNQSDFDRATRDANARLIAAAPDLFAACMHALGCLENEDGDPRLMLRAALDKATGKALP